MLVRLHPMQDIYIYIHIHIYIYMEDLSPKKPLEGSRFGGLKEGVSYKQPLSFIQGSLAQ